MTHTTVFLLVVVAALQLADIWTTRRAWRLGATELNPLMARLMRAIGPVPALVLVKAVLLAVLWRFPVHWLASLAVLAIYSGVVILNLRVIANLERSRA